MRDSLQPGLRYEHRFLVPPSKTVPALYPEAEEFAAMPDVFATGFLVGFLERACIRALSSRGRHERVVIDRARFGARLAQKLSR